MNYCCVKTITFRKTGVVMVSHLLNQALGKIPFSAYPRLHLGMRNTERVSFRLDYEDGFGIGLRQNMPIKIRKFKTEKDFAYVVKQPRHGNLFRVSKTLSSGNNLGN